MGNRQDTRVILGSLRYKSAPNTTLLFEVPLVQTAKDNKINHAIDIYPYYGSDVSAAIRGGNDLKGALLGPGVHASHGMERTHIKGIEATIELLLNYVK